jgi:histidinol dehydrogenase
VSKLRRIDPAQPDYAARIADLCDRSVAFAPEVERAAAEIVDAVRRRGDAALIEYTRRFDQRPPDAAGSYELPAAEWRARAAGVDTAVRAALGRAAGRIRAFHEAQGSAACQVESGKLALRVVPLRRVGLYVPGGTARYPSSVLMTAIPARVAGVDEIVMVTPGASAETLAAAEVAGVDRVFEIGGAQAVAALAFGTATVPRVDKIVGPGNQWVAAAKRLVFGQVDIDSIAGPSELLVVADDSAEPAWIAADLLAQAEHDVEARPILVSTSAALCDAVDAALAQQLASLPRRDIAAAALSRHGAAVLVTDLEQALAVAERYAPEHLELLVRDADALASRVRAAGAVFVGPYSPEAAGDYLAGPNHVLPTGGAARYASPLGVYDFCKYVSVIRYERADLAAQHRDIECLAEVEGLHGHGRSAAIRFRR